MANPVKPGWDFSGWATMFGLQCSDGRIIGHGAFDHQDGMELPMVWNHNHNDPNMVIGKAILQKRPKGMYAYGYLNHSEMGETSRELVRHGDVTHMSIWANQLRQNGPNVVHGEIREVSLVLAGANPGAVIESVMAHADDDTTGWAEFVGGSIDLIHADDNNEEEADMAADNKEKTVQDVIDSMTEEQQNVYYGSLAALAEQMGAVDDEDEEDDDMSHNLFENNNDEGVLSHSEMNDILHGAISDRASSLREAFLAHGIENVEVLFPDAKAVSATPDLITRDMAWVSAVMNGAKKLPWDRIKSIHADLTADEARAAGYVTGDFKLEEVFPLLTRDTTPQTVYKKQAMDRDTLIDVDIDAAAFMKGEMRTMWNEEVARAILIGDGRSPLSKQKIKEDHIRPVWTDADLYSIKVVINTTSSTTDDERVRMVRKALIKAYKDYKGSGNPTMFTSDDFLADALLMEDGIGRVIYEDENKLKTALRVKAIETVPAMANQTRQVSGDTHKLLGIVLNMTDYSIGTKNGGQSTLFENFDLDFNQQKWLYEGRVSGALTKPFSAIVIEEVQA